MNGLEHLHAMEEASVLVMKFLDQLSQQVSNTSNKGTLLVPLSLKYHYCCDTRAACQNNIKFAINHKSLIKNWPPVESNDVVEIAPSHEIKNV